METAGVDRAGRDRWWLVVAAGLCIFMAQLDSTVVTVALPTVQDELRLGEAAASWVVLGYLVPMVALGLTAGRWLATVGRRAALVLVVVGFAVASVLAGVAGDAEWLVAARILQGGFAAPLLALGPVLAVEAVSESRRGRALAVVSTLAPLGAITGPAVGGVLVQALGWRSIFYLNVPVAAVVLAVAWRQPRSGAGLRLPRAAWVGEVLLFGAAAVTVLLGLSLAVSVHVGWLVLVGVAAPLLWAWSRTQVSRPVRELLAIPVLARAHVVLATSYTALLGLQFLVPYYLSRVVHATTAVIGLTVLAYPIGSVIAGPVSGFLSDRHGPRHVALAGACVLAAGLVLLVPLGAHWGPGDVAWRLLLVGSGFGLLVTPVQAMAMSAAPPGLIPATSATTNLARHVGLALGPALATSLWALGSYQPSGMRMAMLAFAALGAVNVAVTARDAVTALSNRTTNPTEEA